MAVIVALFSGSGCFAPANSARTAPSETAAEIPAELTEATPKASAPVVESPEIPADPLPIPVNEEPLAITFEDLDLKMEPDTLFEDWMLTAGVKQKLNHRVRLTGFLCGGCVFQLSGITEIPLLREKECPYGPGGQAHHVVDVRMRTGNSLTFTTQPVLLEGKLTLSPFTGPNGKTWSLYRLDDTVQVRQ